jgi:hypothetical protein
MSLVVMHDHDQASLQQVWNAIAELDGVLLSYVQMSLPAIWIYRRLRFRPISFWNTAPAHESCRDA